MAGLLCLAPAVGFADTGAVEQAGRSRHCDAYCVPHASRCKVQVPDRQIKALIATSREASTQMPVTIVTSKTMFIVMELAILFSLNCLA